MPSTYRVTLHVNVTITDEDALAAAVHDETVLQFEDKGGVVPNDFVDNVQQAADIVAHEPRRAVSVAVMRAMRVGIPSVPGAEFGDFEISNEPM